MGAVTQTGATAGSTGVVGGAGVASPTAPRVASATPVVLQFSPSSLDIRTEIAIDTGRRRVFDAMLHIAAWWPHRVRAGTAIVLEPRVGGRFFENCDDGCGILLGHLARLITPDEFAIEGTLGLGGPVSALWSVSLHADGHTRTVLNGRLQAFGAIDDAVQKAAPEQWSAVYNALAHYLAA